MIADNRPAHPAIRLVGMAACSALLRLAKTPRAGDKLADHEEEIGREILGQIVPDKCGPSCPFLVAAVAGGQVLHSGCWLRLQPLWGGRCPLRPPAEPPAAPNPNPEVPHGS